MQIEKRFIYNVVKSYFNRLHTIIIYLLQVDFLILVACNTLINYFLIQDFKICFALETICHMLMLIHCTLAFNIHLYMGYFRLLRLWVWCLFYRVQINSNLFLLLLLPAAPMVNIHDRELRKLEEEHRRREEEAREKDRQLREREQRAVAEKEQREKEQRELREKEKEKAREREAQEKEARDRERMQHFSNIERMNYGQIPRNLSLLSPLLPPGLSSSLSLGRLPPQSALHAMPPMSSYLSAPPRQSPHSAMALNLGLSSLNLPPPPPSVHGSSSLNHLSHHLPHQSVSSSLALAQYAAVQSGMPARRSSQEERLSLGHHPPTSIGMSHTTIPSSSLNLSHHPGGLNLSHASTTASSALSHHTHTTTANSGSINLTHSGSPSESLNLTTQSPSREPTPAHNNSNIPAGQAHIAHFYQTITHLQPQSLHLQHQPKPQHVSQGQSNHLPTRVSTSTGDLLAEHNHISLLSKHKQSPAIDTISLTNQNPPRNNKSPHALQQSVNLAKTDSANSDLINPKLGLTRSRTPVHTTSSAFEQNGRGKVFVENAVDESAEKSRLNVGHTKEDAKNLNVEPGDDKKGNENLDSNPTSASVAFAETLPIAIPNDDADSIPVSLAPTEDNKNILSSPSADDTNIPSTNSHSNPIPIVDKAIISNKESIPINNTSSEDVSGGGRSSSSPPSTPPPQPPSQPLPTATSPVIPVAIDVAAELIPVTENLVETTAAATTPSVPTNNADVIDAVNTETSVDTINLIK